MRASHDLACELLMQNRSVISFLDSIEANVGNAAANIEEGNVQLEKARDYQVCLATILIYFKCNLKRTMISFQETKPVASSRGVSKSHLPT